MPEQPPATNSPLHYHHTSHKYRCDSRVSIGGWIGIGLGITIILLTIYLLGYGIYKIWGVLHPRDSTTKGELR